MLRRYSLYVWVAAVFVASEWLGSYLGIRFASNTLGTLYQYLDPVVLQDDLARGLYYLHAQPPLFNLFLGVVVKLFPEAYDTVFAAIFGALALGTLVGMAWLMRKLRIPDTFTGALILLFAISPNFLVYRAWLFYTLPIAFLLLAAAIALTLYLEQSSRGALIAFAALALAVMLTRSVFHPLWLVLVAAALVPFVGERKRFAVACAVPFLVVNLLFLKNYLLVESYSGSTWLGLSLTKRWPFSQREMAALKADGRVPEYWQRRPFQSPDYYRAFGFFPPAKDATFVHPALDAPYQSNGEPNFNHRDYVRISEALFEADVGLIASYPDRYLRRVVTAMMLFLQPGPNSVHFLVDYDFERVHRYRDAWTQYVFLGGRIERPIRMLAPPANLWLVLFPLLLVIGCAGKPRGPFVFMLVCIVWVAAVTNLVEIGENDRMRWEVEPFLVILAAFAASRALLLLRRLKRP